MRTQFKQDIYKSSFHEIIDRVHPEDDLARHLENVALVDLHPPAVVLQDGWKLFVTIQWSDGIPEHGQTNIPNSVLLVRYVESESLWEVQVQVEILEVPVRRIFEQFTKWEQNRGGPNKYLILTLCSAKKI